MSVSLPELRPPGGVQKAVSDARALPAAVLGGTRDEIVGVWRDARALSDSWGSGEKGPRIGGQPSADSVYLTWYAGLGVMALARLIEWRLAAVIAVAHTVEHYGHRQRLREFVEGADSAI